MRKLRIGLVGDYQSGKSLLINCLLRRPVATVGRRTATTHIVVQYTYSANEYIEYFDETGRHLFHISNISRFEKDCGIKELMVYINNPILKDVILYDMPGLGSNEADDTTAITVIGKLDYAILLSTNYMGISIESSSFDCLGLLKRNRIPYYFFINSTNTSIYNWNPTSEHNSVIAEHDREYLDYYKPINYNPDNSGEFIINLLWYWFSINDKSDSIIQLYTKDLQANGLYDSDVSKDDIELASNFFKVEYIFSMDNQQYLRLKSEFKEELQLLKEEICPIGTIQTFPFEKPPYGWLPCDGSELLIAEYRELYSFIGNIFGGDGELSFCLPDLRNQFVRGWQGPNSERKLGETQQDAIQEHVHNIKIDKQIQTEESGDHKHKVYYHSHAVRDSGAFGSDYSVYEVSFGSSSDKISDNGSGTTYEGNHSHNVKFKIESKTNAMINARYDNETRPMNMALLFCIRAK